MIFEESCSFLIREFHAHPHPPPSSFEGCPKCNFLLHKSYKLERLILENPVIELARNFHRLIAFSFLVLIQSKNLSLTQTHKLTELHSSSFFLINDKSLN